jgi:hypothetical protein
MGATEVEQPPPVCQLCGLVVRLLPLGKTRVCIACFFQSSPWGRLASLGLDCAMGSVSNSSLSLSLSLSLPQKYHAAKTTVQPPPSKALVIPPT